MELTPNDVRNYEFPAKVRGYDKDTVDNFRERVAIRLETLTQENLKLSMEADSLRTQLVALRQLEDAIKNAAIDARRNADSTIADAKRQAEDILAVARKDAKQVGAAHNQHKAELESEIAKLELTKKSYLTKLRNLINSHLEWVDDITKTELPAGLKSEFEFPVSSDEPAPTRHPVYEIEDRLDVTDSTEMTAKQRETFATEPSDTAPTRTEEVNAASRIVTVDQITAPADKDQSPIDPELAAALNNYQKVTDSRSQKDTRTTDADSTGKVTMPRPEPPLGYVSKEGKVVVDKTKAAGLEFSSVNVDAPITPAKPVDSPESLAAVLDNVVHKFEEEMDKAARS